MLLRRYSRISLKNTEVLESFYKDLVEGQERNTAQLAKIRAVVDQRWSWKENLQSSNKKDEKKDREDGERSEEEPEES